ncbi:hypothetical protein NKH99_31415 [Mesorhizobium sp. M0854]|uniref:hypothetical protein n=1 Tax=Mesorhizobium sp. M0854 TaxID=2957013 RepID=UPI003338ECA0
MPVRRDLDEIDPAVIGGDPRDRFAAVIAEILCCQEWPRAATVAAISAPTAPL